MASILKVDELQGIVSAGNITVTSEGGAATQSLQQGLAKGWARFKTSTTTVLNDSLNVTTLTDLGTGNTQINLTNSMNDTNYAVLGMSQYLNNTGQTIMEGPSDITTGSYEVYTKSNTNTVFDADFNSTSILGDLA